MKKMTHPILPTSIFFLECSLSHSRKSPMIQYYSCLEMEFLFKVSQAVQELKQYTEQYQREDPLVVGIPTSMNPFKDKRPCSML